MSLSLEACAVAKVKDTDVFVFEVVSGGHVYQVLVCNLVMYHQKFGDVRHAVVATTGKTAMCGSTQPIWPEGGLNSLPEWTEEEVESNAKAPVFR